MEQRLDASYLRAGLVERATAIGITSVGIGTGTLVAAWGVSLLWRYTPPEIAVRIANPVIRVEPLKIDAGDLGNRVEQLRREAKTVGGNVISREVTVFSNVNHGPGVVVTGWSYRDGSGREPVRQYCYYTAPKPNGSSTKVDIASDGVRTPDIGTTLVPDLEGALAKCQWWQG